MWQKLIAFLERVQHAWLSVDNVSLRVLLELAMVLVVSYASFLICQLCYLAIRRRILKRKPEGLPKLIFSSHAIDRALQVMPLIVAGLLATRAISTLWLSATILMLTHIYFIFICANVFAAAMSLIYCISNWRRGVTASPQKGIFQVLALLGYLFAAVGIVATLSGRDPTYVLSGMTALSAVLMLVFKDSILGLTAGITLASNGMVRIRDWIEVPGTGADGEVIDIALTTVRVQNWDNTITTVPAYDLIAKPFKNWRGMSESGGRRIKRAILIDLDSIHFADDEEIERWKKIDLLRDYLASKIREIHSYNAAHPSSATSVVNARKLTNIGTFRAYCLAYLRANPDIHQGLTLIVRQLDPSDRGLPLEIYCFSSDTAWANYESIQSDLFDHLLAIMPEFGLISFQVTSATALRQGLHVLPERPKAKA